MEGAAICAHCMHRYEHGRAIKVAISVHDLHRPLVMTANIRGGNNGHRQSLGVGDVRSHIAAML
jgi:hypothetical protein